MPANSIPRRIAKVALRHILDENRYSYVQCVAKSWDIWSGSWTEPELALVECAVLPGDDVLDLGANFGLYCYHLSRAVGHRGKVWAFEPVPFTFTTCRRVLKALRLHNVELVEKGCSDVNERTTFNVPVASTGTLSAGQAFISSRDDDQPGKESQVRWATTREIAAEVVRLDDFLPKLNDITFMKIDIEGAEAFALRGASALIDRHLPTIVCEINPFFLKGFGLSMDDLVRPLRDRGYELFRYDDVLRQLKPIAESAIVEDNYAFVHPRRRERLSRLL